MLKAIAVVGVVLLGISGIVSAGPVTEVAPPSFSVGLRGVVAEQTSRPELGRFAQRTGQRLWQLNEPVRLSLEEVTVDIERFSFDPDPVVTMVVAVSNNSDTIQTINFSATLPTTFAAPNLISGLVATTVEARSAAGATIAAPAGGAIYTALIDGAPVATLQSDVFSLFTSPQMATATSSAGFGPTASAIAVGSSMGIDLSFTLSPGDVARIEATFEVVPEPASLGLLLAGGVALLRRRRV